MNLEILLPFRIFLRRESVLRIVAETIDGSFGLLPRRLDCVAALTPGILTFETLAEGEVFVAIDEGVIIKTGPEVRVSVRRAILGKDLASLRTAVAQEFRAQDEDAQIRRQLLSKLESGFVARLSRLQVPSP
ncbi:MAG: F0F1 ATP synthase subunit epsilon [Burkholderiaceae bacterium]